MRIGENPTKFARHNPELVTLEARTPAPLSITTVTYVPRTSDYYKDGLTILRVTLDAIRRNTQVPFDLMVFDNGSCPEVVDFLRELRDRDAIQWLCLSSANMKKLGAWNYLFSAALGDWVYYFDSDILHHPGWYEATMRVMEVFPEAATVNAAPLPIAQPQNVAAGLAAVRADEGTRVEEGQFLEDGWLRSFAQSLGADPDLYLQRARTHPQVRLTRNGAAAYVQGWHAQFLARGDILRRLFPRPRDWALSASDSSFDAAINECGHLRLGTTEPYVTHLGNALTPQTAETIRRMGLAAEAGSWRPAAETPSFTAKLLGLGPIRRLVLRLHALTFHLLYNIR